jgi:hypothetical protein
MRSLALGVVVLALAAGGCGSDEPPADAAVMDAAVDASAACTVDAGHCLVVDDAGVSHGCAAGSMGPGDRDDGGGLGLAGRPDASADAMNLPFGAECLDNAQCQSQICFDYRVKGWFCTRFCSCDSDCPAPSLGCGGQGVCRMGYQ